MKSNVSFCRHFVILLLVIFAITFSACEKESDVVTPEEELTAVSHKWRIKKIKICYSNRNGHCRIIKIKKSAWKWYKKRGAVRLDDQDGDGYVPDNACGYGKMGDCDDNDASKNPEIAGSCGGEIDSDGDGVPDDEDECPDESGSIELNGCPDADGDGIADKDDDCPFEAGLPNLSGCPDADGDGVADINDDCPNEAGSADNNGCPYRDTDGDGVIDINDIDDDNDGILDVVENPDEGMGIDTDGDGIVNHHDIDSDNDGIPDNVEAQTTAGYIAPNGDDVATWSANNGLNSAYLPNGLTPEITEGTEPDYVDIDSDNDWVPDNNEGNDFNFDGMPNQTFTGVDSDLDGLDDGYEGTNVHDGFDVNDEINDPANDLLDTDGIADVNYRDIDDDSDGIDTPNEDADGDGNPSNDDTDQDGTPDYLDPSNN
ncbi:hypothetical protein N9Y48_00660 [Zobellia sp.]|nr:hypothetical protein [Zobellia sp.]